jgi:hypothetical protein
MLRPTGQVWMGAHAQLVLGQMRPALAQRAAEEEAKAESVLHMQHGVHPDSGRCDVVLGCVQAEGIPPAQA